MANIRTIVGLENSEYDEGERRDADRPIQSGTDRVNEEVGQQWNETSECIACSDCLQVEKD